MLKGTDIYLRTIEPSDVHFILENENNTDNWKISNTQVPFSEELIIHYVHHAQDIYSLKQVRFIICLTADDSRIGMIDLFEFEPLHQRAGIGILILAAHQQLGHGKSALKIIEEYALKSLGIRNLFCNILAGNEQSHHLFLNNGFVQVGIKKNWFNDRGNWVDEILYQKSFV